MNDYRMLQTGLGLSYEYDAMGRMSRMTNTDDQTEFVGNTVYNAAGQLTQWRRAGWSIEGFSYNVQGQVTQHTAPGVNFEYRYDYAGDGTLRQRKDWISGEEVNYTYNVLGQLIKAETTSPEWGMAWTYDGFGNRTQQTAVKGSVPTVSLTVDPATNRAGGAHDAAGNLTQYNHGLTWANMSYDLAGRMKMYTAAGSSANYNYTASNQRLAVAKAGRFEVHFYGIDGLRLGVYRMEIFNNNPSYTYPVRIVDQERVYAGGRLILEGGTQVVTDRLGTVVARSGNAAARQYPYGEEIGGATENDRAKFGTYTRDSHSGLDYATNRYYFSNWGRFTTPDPYRASGGPANPQSWNRYAYVEGDPVNFGDPRGLQMQQPGCIYSGFSAPGGSIDTSTDCPPGYIEDWTSGGGGGGFSLTDTRSTPTFSIDVFRRLRNAAALGALLRNLSYSGGAPVPATLRLQNICWTEAEPSAGSFAYTLRVTYRIFDGEGKPMSAASLAGITITEQFWEVSGNTNIQEHPGSWNIYKRDGINADGTFVDYLSAGGGLAGYSRSGSALQGFYAHGFLSNGIPLFHQPLVVYGFGSPTTVLSNIYTTNSVTVNGLGLGNNPSTRCH